MHKVLKSFDFHTDSVTAMTTNNSMTKLITGSRNGEIYVTDLQRISFTKLDTVLDPITSICVNSNYDLLCATSTCKLYEYVSN